MEFFDRYYLQADEEADFDPLFYNSETFVKEPPYHGTLLEEFASRRLVAAVAPRGSAKSVLLRKVMIMTALMKPNTQIAYFTATDSLARNVGDFVRAQLYHNERIQEDFGPEAVGPGEKPTLKPTKGDKPTGTEVFALTNNSKIYFRSILGRQRGIRVNLAIIDDPEYDESASTSMQVLRDNMSRAVSKVILPMVQQRGTKMWWIGTFVSKRHYLWQIMDTQTVEKDGQSYQVAKDPRFNKWFRMIVEDCWYDEKGARHSFWPHQHPADEQECQRLGIDPEDVQTLEDIEAEIGTAAYSSEYRARPGEGDTNYFPSLEKERHGWWLEGGDVLAPLNSPTSTLVCWLRKQDGVQTTIKMPIGEFCSKYGRIALLDTSYTAKPGSDRKTVAVMAITEHNERFVLDGWSDVCRRRDQVYKAFELARRWQVTMLCPEAVKEGLTLYQDLCEAVNTRSEALSGGTYFPAVRKLNVGMADKTSKIASLHSLVENDLIKLPWHLKAEGFFVRLFEQFAGFYPDANDGGLEKDDEIDTVQMHRFAFQGLPSVPVETKEPDTREAMVEKLRSSDPFDEFGNPIIFNAFDQLSPHELIAISQEANNREPDDGWL